MPTVDQALETSAGLVLPWGQIDSMVIRSSTESTHALVLLDLRLTRPETETPLRGSQPGPDHQSLGRWTSAAGSTAAMTVLGVENWPVALFLGAAAGLAASEITAKHGFSDETAEYVAPEEARSVGIGVRIDTETFEPSAFYGDIDRFEDVVGELNVAAMFTEVRDEALGRAWDAACLDHAATTRSDDPDDWWAYWLAYREVTRQNRRNTV